jgi:hypothetical protein
LQLTRMKYFLAGLFLFVLTSPVSDATTFYEIEEMSGWKWCSACAGAGGEGLMEKKMSGSPTLDGLSSRFFVGGSTPWSHALYHRRMSSNDSVKNFFLEFNYYMKNPAASSGMEFSVNQVVGKYWYRWDTQCSYESKIWKIWDGKNMKWINLSAPCPRPSGYSWNNVKFECKRVDGKTQFVSITLNGKKYYVNKYVGPTWLGYYDPNIGIHFQLNGNRYMTDYYVWGDRFKLDYW